MGPNPKSPNPKSPNPKFPNPNPNWKVPEWMQVEGIPFSKPKIDIHGNYNMDPDVIYSNAAGIKTGQICVDNTVIAPKPLNPEPLNPEPLNP